MVLATEVLISGGRPLHAADLYVAPNGTASGKGTEHRPYDLVTALSGDVGKPGDTFWLREGTYQLGQEYTEMHGEPGRPVTFRAMAGERAQLVGSLTIGGKKGHLVFRDFELCSGVDRRMSKKTGAGFKPKDIPHFTEGIQDYAPNVSFINLVVHDSVRSGFYTSSEATNVLIYGCIVYNTGWASPDNAEGHSFYLQAGGEVAESIGCNSTGAGFHVYANGAGDSVRNLTLTGNVAWGAGALQTVRVYRDWILGVDCPAVKADNIVLRENMGYLPPNTRRVTPVELGRENTNGSLVLISNYFPQGVTMGHWSKVVDVGNTIALEGSRGRSPDQLSPHGTKVFVRTNRFEQGRANIVVYNWDNRNSIEVDVRAVLPTGARYEVRNAQDFFSEPVVSGTFNGEPLQLPMNGLSTAKPMAPLRTAPATGPAFNVFVLRVVGGR